MDWIEIILCVLFGLFVAIIGFIYLLTWLIDEGFKSKYKEEQEMLKQNTKQ